MGDSRQVDQHGGMDFPKTAWTRIARAADTAGADYVTELCALVALYDKPLSELFRRRVGGRFRSESEDWKQDFIISHLLTGRMFRDARPGGRFRAYLAVGARNYIASRLEHAGAAKRGADYAAPLSAREDGFAGDSQVQHIADGDSLEADERLLSRYRAFDCIENAKERLGNWAAQSGDPVLVGAASRLCSENHGIARLPKSGTPERRAVDAFKTFIRNAVREEVIVRAGEDPVAVLDREVAILFDAIRTDPNPSSLT